MPLTDQRLAVLLDRAELAELVDRYIVTLDTAEEPDRDLEWYREIFTDDVRLSFPIGDREGIEGLPEFQKKAKLAWGATHHLGANHLVQLRGDEASVRVQIAGTHVEHDTETMGVDPAKRLDMGGYYDIQAVRTERGWRLSALRFVLVWTSGGGTPRTGEYPVRDA